MSEAPTMRAFCALNLDVASVRRLHDTALALRAHALAPQARWVPPTKMHVTLKFFGEVDVGLGPALGDAIAPLAGERVIKVQLTRLAGFPDDDRARVVVALVDDTEGEIRRISESVEEATNRLGLDREALELRPHLTLARLGRPGAIAAWLGSVRLPAEPATVTELVLYRSDFSSAGHEYVALARFGMGSARAKP
jgi:RNA 2',3'-cyclic 3'-phosphodiesterase